MNGRKALRVRDTLQHILQAVERIQVYVDQVDQATFLASPMLQDAVIRNIEIIGEAANTILSLDKAFEENHPGVEFRAAYAMRNALSHGYFTVNPVVVWATVRNDIPVLKAQVMEASKNYPAAP